MDIEAEQEVELEALNAILMDDLIIHEGSTPPGFGSNKIYKVILKPDEDQDDDGSKKNLSCRLEFIFSFSPNYPNEPPFYRLRSLTGISDQKILEVTKEVEDCIQENIGMPMIFTLIECAKEWLINKLSLDQGLKGMSEKELLKKKEEEEEARRQETRSHGTPVTIENFLKWKLEFDAEMSLKDAEISIDKAENKKLSGKQYFLLQIKDEGSIPEDEEDDEGEDGDDQYFEFDDDDDDGLIENYLAKSSITT